MITLSITYQNGYGVGAGYTDREADRAEGDARRYVELNVVRSVRVTDGNGETIFEQEKEGRDRQRAERDQS